MLRYAIFFLLIAIVAGILGFGGLANDLAWIAKIVFLVFIVLFLASFVLGKKPPV